MTPTRYVRATTGCALLSLVLTSGLACFSCRYQVLAGVVEERGIETIFKGNYKLCAALSFLVRTGNTFLGSLLWVDFVRLLGMQKASH